MKAVHFCIGPFFGGIIFSFGLGVGGMTEAKNIICFLNFLGDWKPDLIFVMVGALLVNSILYKLIIKRGKPLFEGQFSLPTIKNLDLRLIIGSLMFGLGWGITGLCPGPGIVTLISGSSHSIVFVATMAVGMLIGRSDFGQKLFLKK